MVADVHNVSYGMDHWTSFVGSHWSLDDVAITVEGINALMFLLPETALTDDPDEGVYHRALSKTMGILNGTGASEVLRM